MLQACLYAACLHTHTSPQYPPPPPSPLPHTPPPPPLPACTHKHELSFSPLPCHQQPHHTPAPLQDKYKASYDLKSEKASLEWNRKPYKVTLSSSVNSSGVGKPSVSANWEQAFDL